MVENKTAEDKHIIERAYNKMKSRRDNSVCSLCHSSLPSRVFALTLCIGITEGPVNGDCKLVKYLRELSS